MTMRRWALALLAATCVSALAVGAATATPPEREPAIFEDFILEDVCSFPVDVAFIANKERLTFFSDGRVHVSGTLVVRLTNLDDPTNVLTLNISGPALLAPNERFFGRSLNPFFQNDAGGPSLIFTTGRVDIVRAEDGSIIEFTTRAPTKDVCAALA
jgi:hypothetical protein